MAAGGTFLFNQGKGGLIGNPGSAGGGEASGGTAGEPGIGQGPRQGGDIDFEDGSGFTGGSRNEELPDFSVGSEPLVGFPSNSEEDDENSKSVLSSLGRLPDKAADDDE